MPHRQPVCRRYLYNSLHYAPPHLLCPCGFGAVRTLVNGCSATGCVQTQETYTYNNRLQPVMIQDGQSGGNLSATSCTVYDYYLGTGNPSSCAVPSQASGGNNGSVMGYWYTNTAHTAFTHSAGFVYDGVNRLTSAVATPFRAVSA